MMRLCVVLLFQAFTVVYAYPIENSYEKLLQQVNELQRTVAKLEKSVEQNSLMARNKRSKLYLMYFIVLNRSCRDGHSKKCCSFNTLFQLFVI
jgi:hypothetical protein